MDPLEGLRVNDVTCGDYPVVGWMDDNAKTLTAGKLIKHLRKFKPSQKIYYQSDDGELVPIMYAELSEWR